MITAYVGKEIDKGRLIKYAEKLLDKYSWVSVYKGRNNDIVLVPENYPNSIANLINVLEVSQQAIFQLNNEIDALDAEIALAIEASHIRKVLLDYEDTFDIDRFNSIFKGMLVTKTTREIKQEQAKVIKLVKHFTAKGIGTIAIGFVSSGTITKGEKLFINGKEGLIREIQLMDVSVEKAEEGSYIGLSIPNIKDEEFENIDYITSEVKERSIRIEKLPIYKGEMKQAKVNFLGINLDYKEKLSIPQISFGIVYDPSLTKGKNRIVGKALA